MITKLNRHGKEVFGNDTYLNQHKQICICHQCAKLDLDPNKNCSIAKKTFDLSKEVGIVLVMECKDFTNK